MHLLASKTSLSLEDVI